MDNEDLKWIESDGGPHIFIENKLLDIWGKSSENYSTAYEIEDYLGVITVGNGQGLVLSEDIARSTWIPFEKEDGGFLVIWNYAEEGITNEKIIKKIKLIDNENFIKENFHFEIEDSTVCLFSASEDGKDFIYGCLEAKLKPGLYEVSSINNYEFDECSFRIHRLMLTKQNS